MHKLTHVEAQRMMAVLGESLEKLSLVCSLPSTPSGVLLDTLYDNDMGEIAAAVETQWQLEESHRLIQTQAVKRSRRHSIKAARPKTPAAVELQMQLHVSTRNLCRLLR
jgi:hypothetical protein